MQVTMNDSHINTVEQVKDILKSGEFPAFNVVSKKEAYRWVRENLIKFSYAMLDRKSKGAIRQYLIQMTGYSRAQITRLISKYRKTGYVKLANYKRHRFERRYFPEDVKLLAETDEAHQFLNGPATKTILERQVEVFGKKEYENISKISVSHLYNLRGSTPYKRMVKRYTPTRPSVSNIGERRKPEPNGRPGYLRVDTVHQGDKDGEKGVYHINTIDEVTQFEIVGAVEKISEMFMEPMLKLMLKAYPFKILGFHPDNGSEFINHTVARLLNKLLAELTKSRPRHPNDNALVEGKNGSIVRKHIGYTHIKQKHAEKLNRLYFGYLNNYLNYHRPCAFPTEIEDKKKKGKIKKVYLQKDYQTPYDKLKNLENAKQYLKEGVTFEKLDKIAHTYDDNQYAEIVQKEKDEMFDEIFSPYSIKGHISN